LTHFSEPFSRTLRRTVGLAIAIGAIIALIRHRLALFPLGVEFALWFTLGGHFVELVCRNQLRPLISNRIVGFVVRIVAWFVGGSLLYAGALSTRALVFPQHRSTMPWWIGGVAFIGGELLIHLLLLARGEPSVYNSRG
jgi:hypothetical protein